jgi:hypothetical protein
MSTNMTSMQAQINQNQPHKDKHQQFMSHCPPVFSHAVDPLEADDWLKTVEKMLTIAQCDDREKVLYASGRLQGTASACWDAYVAAHATPDAITWQEFTTSFKSYHIPASLMKLKKKEFLALKQGEMSVIEYRDKFVGLSRYAPKEVVDDVNKQELFLEGFAEPLQYQLISHTFPSFQMLLDKAIGLEYIRKELEDLNRKATTLGQSGSNTRPRFNPPQETPFQFGGSIEDFGQQQFQCPVQQTSRPLSLRNRQMAPVVAPVKTNTPRGTACLRCGKVGHYVTACPKRNAPNTPAQSQHSQQMRNESRISKGSKGKQGYARGRVNHVSVETAQENPRVVFGMCLVNSALASVLFDARATHSIITSHYAAKLNIPMSTMPRPMLVSSARGDMKAIYRCNRVISSPHQFRQRTD